MYKKLYTHEDILYKQLFVFVNSAVERHMIYLRKELGFPKPWTDMEPFKDWFFCNLFRRLDKTTKVICEKVIRGNEDKPTLWAAILICRWFSYIPTIEALVANDCLFTQEGWQRGIDVVGKIRASGKSFTTAGFMLNQNIQGYKGIGKNVVPFLIVKLLAETFYDSFASREVSLYEKVEQFDQRLRQRKRLKDMFDMFLKAPATAGFMAYEYVTDLAYTERYNSNPKLIDYYSWCSCTVGSLRGLKRLCGLPYSSPANLDIVDMTNYLRDFLAKACGSAFESMDPDLRNHPHAKCLKDISMREVEHWLCEYDKFSRILYREKRMKRKYNGR